MTIKQLKAACEKQIELGNGDAEVFMMRNDKSDLPTGNYQEPLRVNHYDDGLVIIVDSITE